MYETAVAHLINYGLKPGTYFYFKYKMRIVTLHVTNRSVIPRGIVPAPRHVGQTTRSPKNSSPPVDLRGEDPDDTLLCSRTGAKDG